MNPNYAAGRAYRAFAPRAWTRVREIVQDLVASGLIVMPSGAADFNNPELRPLLDRFYVGSGGYDAEHKVKLMKLLWDAIGTEFAGRHELYERNYAGNNESTTLDAYFAAHQNGNADAMKAFAEALHGRLRPRRAGSAKTCSTDSAPALSDAARRPARSGGPWPHHEGLREIPRRCSARPWPVRLGPHGGGGRRCCGHS